jgi:hypothetical protein
MKVPQIKNSKAGAAFVILDGAGQRKKCIDFDNFSNFKQVIAIVGKATKILLIKKRNSKSPSN